VFTSNGAPLLLLDGTIQAIAVVHALDVWVVRDGIKHQALEGLGFIDRWCSSSSSIGSHKRRCGCDGACRRSNTHHLRRNITQPPTGPTERLHHLLWWDEPVFEWTIMQ
jgi:hypothetical protein